jgi:cytosine/adenosine deaminase-related metal-dependent hydrolase
MVTLFVTLHGKLTCQAVHGRYMPIMIITADQLVTESGLRARHMAIVINHDRIADVGLQHDMIRKYRGHRVLRFEHSLCMPGLVNVHTHLELPPLPIRSRRVDYTRWILNLIKFKKRLSERDYLSAARENIGTLIRTGTTTVGEICTHAVSRILLVQSGLRAIAYHEIISLEPRIPRDRLPSVSSRTASLVRDGLSPHSAHTVSESVLTAIRDRAARRRLPLAMHVAETADELRLLRREQSGLSRLYAAAGWPLDSAPRARSTVDYLDRCGVLDPRFLCVHAVHIDDRDIAILKRSGAAIAHCPRSNHRMGVGTMPLSKVLAAGIPVGIGTDSLASVPNLNMWDEMRAALRLHRERGITPRNLLHLATLGGAQTLGMEDTIGSLAPGKKADIIVIPLPRRNTGDLYSDLLRETKSSIMTMVNGRILHQERR